MKKTLLLVLLGFYSIGIYAAEQCKIVNKEYTYKPSKELTFKNRLLNKLSFEIPSPLQMMYQSDSPIFIYNKNKYIGYQLIAESFGSKENQAMLLKSKWEFKCDTPVIELTTKDYQILILDDEFKATDAIYKTVFFINDSKKYYYLIAFKGFTNQEFEQIISTIKQGE